jgi:DNA-binding NarL/FixJ family response regulator
MPAAGSATLIAMRVVIADDHRLMLDGIRRALESDGGFEIVGETQDGAEVLEIVARTLPDLVVLDVRMPHVDGLACLDEIVARHPAIKVVMLSASTSQDLIASALRRGASAYLAKSVDPSDLPSTLRQVLEGNVWSMSDIPVDDDDPTRDLGLTERERSILAALARGLSNAEIAKELWITQQTVKFHLTNIYRKLGVKTRTEAMRIAYEHGLAGSQFETDA